MRAGRAAAAEEAEARLAAECTFRPQLCAAPAGAKAGCGAAGAGCAAGRENAEPRSPATLLRGQARAGRVQNAWRGSRCALDLETVQRLMAWCGGRGHDSTVCHFKCQLCQSTHETANLNKTLHNKPMNIKP